MPPPPKPVLTPAAIPLAIVRFLLLSGQVGLASGALSVVAMCFEGCGGYGEVLYGAAIAIAGGLTAFCLLVGHYVHNFKSNPQRLLRQSRLQWAWLVASFAVYVLVTT